MEEGGSGRVGRHTVRPQGPLPPRSVPAAPRLHSAGFAARSVSLPGPQSVASVDRQARSKRLTCSAFGALRGRTRNLPSRLVEIFAEKVNIPLRGSCAPRKGKGIPSVKEKREEQTEEIMLYPGAVPSSQPPILGLVGPLIPPGPEQPLIFAYVLYISHGWGRVGFRLCVCFFGLSTVFSALTQVV